MSGYDKEKSLDYALKMYNRDVRPVTVKPRELGGMSLRQFLSGFWDKAEKSGILKEKNITFLDNEYINISHRHSFQCGECNYEWKTKLNSVLNGKTGCSRCVGLEPWKLERKILFGFYHKAYWNKLAKIKT